MKRLMKQKPCIQNKRIQYSVSEVQDLGINMRKKVRAQKAPKASVLKRDMSVVWKPKIKKIVRAKADEFLLTLKPKEAYLFKIFLAVVRKNPKAPREELNNLVMRIIEQQKGKSVRSEYPVYAGDLIYKKAVKFGAIIAEKV